MHQIREVLRLTSGLGLTQRQTARSMHISRGTVSDIVQRAHGAGLDWPLPLDLSDEGLEKLLYPGPPPGRPALPDPDFNGMRHETTQGVQRTGRKLYCSTTTPGATS